MIRHRGAINNKVFERLGEKKTQLYDVELVKSEFDHKEQIIVGFFILQYAMLRLLEAQYTYFDKFRVVACNCLMSWKWRQIHYLALAEHDLYDCIRPTMRKE